MKRAAIALAFLLMLVTVSAFSQSVVPPTMNFQGRLAKPDGTPVPDNAAQPITFRLFAAATGGTALWSQTGNVAVYNGAFAVVLDFSAGFTGTNTLASVFFSNPYLEIQVGNAAAISPRQTFRSVAYAFNAITANTVPNGSIGLNQLANGLLNFSNIAGQVTGSQIANGTITSANFASSVFPGLTPTQQAILGKFSLGAALGTASVTPTGINPQGIAISGNYCYVFNRGSNTLQIFDVTNPASPVLLNALGTATGSQPDVITVSGKYAYVPCYGSSTLQIFDVSNPAAPALVNRPTGTATGNKPAQCVVSGNYAYVTCYGSNTFQIFDVSNPANPTLINAPGTGPGTALDIICLAVASNYAYVTNQNSNTLKVYDVSNPAAPVLKSTTSTGAFPQVIVVVGNYAYLVCYNSNTLQIFNVSNPAAPVLVNGANGTTTGTNPQFVAVSGNYAYVTNYSGNTLQIFDVSNPANPVLTNTLATGTNPEGVAVSGNNIFIANKGSNTFQIFNMTSALNLAGTLNASGDVNANGTVRANGVALSSDARYKTHIATLNNSLDDVLNLRGVTYDFDREKWPAKHFPEGRQIGFIAQELEKVFPELVQTDANGYKSVMYQNLTPVLVEAIKMLKHDNDDLRAQVKELQAQAKENGDIKKQLAELAAALKKMQDEKKR